MNFTVGDIVRVGKGKVEWTVRKVHGSGVVELESATGTKRTEGSDKLTLTLIRSAELTEYAKTDVQAATDLYDGSETASKPSNDHRESDYGKAILSGLQGKPVYTKSTPWTTVKKRLKAAKAAKQARKAQR